MGKLKGVMFVAAFAIAAAGPATAQAPAPPTVATPTNDSSTLSAAVTPNGATITSCQFELSLVDAPPDTPPVIATSTSTTACTAPIPHNILGTYSVIARVQYTGGPATGAVSETPLSLRLDFPSFGDITHDSAGNVSTPVTGHPFAIASCFYRYSSDGGTTFSQVPGSLDSSNVCTGNIGPIGNGSWQIQVSAIDAYGNLASTADVFTVGSPEPVPYYYAPPPVVVTPPPTEYVERPPEAGYWYYCHDPAGYYPTVSSCPGGWTQVAPRSD